MAQINSQIRFRLSRRRSLSLLQKWILLLGSHQARKRTGSPPFAYPSRIYPPSRGFDRGLYNQPFMDKILALRETLKTKSQNTHWVKMDSPTTSRNFCHSRLRRLRAIFETQT